MNLYESNVRIGDAMRRTAAATVPAMPIDAATPRVQSILRPGGVRKAAAIETAIATAAITSTWPSTPIAKVSPPVTVVMARPMRGAIRIAITR